MSKSISRRKIFEGTLDETQKDKSRALGYLN